MSRYRQILWNGAGRHGSPPRDVNLRAKAVKVIDGITGVELTLARSVLTIGNFDGVHLAHQALLHRAKAHAAEARVPVVVLTFEPHPLAVVAPDRLPPTLTPREEKLRLLERHGADVVVIARSEPALLNRNAEDFVRDVVCRHFRPVCIVEGPSFGFGKGRRGNPELLIRMASELAYQVDVVAAVRVTWSDGRSETVSSSLVRKALAAGHVADAARCLGRPYRLFGVVVKGDRRGHALGFPTANLCVSDQMVPGDGVYGGVAFVEDREWPGAISIGHTPTFAGKDRRTEAHLIGFEGDLYDRPLRIDFHDWIRAQQTFPSPDALIRQLKQDVATVTHLHGVRGSSGGFHDGPFSSKEH